MQRGSHQLTAKLGSTTRSGILSAFSTHETPQAPSLVRTEQSWDRRWLPRAELDNPKTSCGARRMIERTQTNQPIQSHSHLCTLYVPTDKLRGGSCCEITENPVLKKRCQHDLVLCSTRRKKSGSRSVRWGRLTEHGKRLQHHRSNYGGQFYKPTFISPRVLINTKTASLCRRARICTDWPMA